MTPALSTSTEHMLSESLNNLHHKTIEWESNIEFWKHELNFFKKLLNKYGNNLESWKDIKEREHFRELLGYYSGNLMEVLNQKLIQHEADLRPLLDNESHQDEMAYRNEHDALRKQIEAFEQEFKVYKSELYELIEKAMKN